MYRPEWTLKDRKTNTKRTNEKPIATVSIPYISNTSEKIAREYKKHNIKTIFRPSNTIKNNICKLKDKVDELDKSCVIYHIKCQEHKEDYVGETSRAMKTRAYEHKIIKHKESEICHSLKKEEENTENTTGKRSSRLKNKKKMNYKELNDGSNIILNEGLTEVSEHMARFDHKEKVTIKILGREQNWYKRGIIEAMEIAKIKPTLNNDSGRYHISPIYTNLLHCKNKPY